MSFDCRKKKMEISRIDSYKLMTCGLQQLKYHQTEEETERKGKKALKVSLK